MSHVSTRTGQQAGRPKLELMWRRLSLVALSVLAVLSASTAIYVVANHIHFARVLSNSMTPEFERGDVLLLKPVHKTRLTEGDIALLPMIKEPGLQYAHRIINVNSADGVIAVETKGDANPTIDPWRLVITSEEVPLVVGRIPASSIPLVSNTKPVIIALSVLLVLVFVSLVVPLKNFRQFASRSRHKGTHNSG